MLEVPFLGATCPLSVNAAVLVPDPIVNVFTPWLKLAVLPGPEAMVA